MIEARMIDGESGGIQQWVIGLASSLSRLEGTSEEYVFIVREGQADWLEPFLSGQCRSLPAPPPKPDPARADASPKAGAGQGAPKRGQGAGRLSPLRIMRRLRRRLVRRLQAPEHRRWLSPLDQWISEAGADVMHFPRQTAFTTTVPSIYQPWDLQHLHLQEFFTPEARQLRETNYRAYCAQAALIVVASRWVKDDVCAQYGIAPERIAVVNPPPITVAYARPTPDEATRIAERLALPARFAFYPAQPWAHKNHQRLFEALRQLRDKGMTVPLVCSGHRNARYPEVERHAAELGVDDQVLSLGFLTTTEIQVLYDRAALLVFPSLYEGWGLPILEAFAAGLPVACSNVTSLPELVGDAALVFEPDDVDAIAAAIERLWTDDVLRRELTERGQKRLGDFDWRTTALTMRAHYRQVGGRRLDVADRSLLAAGSLV